MTLADSSVWIDHFRHSNRRLASLLEAGECQTHEAIIGELACGNLPRREETLSLLAVLPQVQPATAVETMWLVGTARLHGCGLGWIDMLLLASALAAGSTLWTLDERLARAARRLGCA